MSTLNQCTLMGRLGTDPEMRYSQGGKAITKFRIATDRGWGENKETDWHSIVCFDKTAENCAQHLLKGQLVTVCGRIEYSKWDKDDGTTSWFTNIVAFKIIFGEKMGGGNERGRGGGGKPRGKPKQETSTAKSGEFDDSFADSDIPF